MENKSNVMSVKQAIYQRKSTRAFLEDKTIPREELEEIITAGMRAPSPKNRQPWNFCVVEAKEQKEQLRNIMKCTLEQLKNTRIAQGQDIADLVMADFSADILSQASAVIFVGYERDSSNEHGETIEWGITAQAFEVADIQSIGAAIQNMLLQATAMGVASLWMCDVLYAHDEICDYLGMHSPFVAAIALGYEPPYRGNRKSITEKVVWKNGPQEKKI